MYTFSFAINQTRLELTPILRILTPLSLYLVRIRGRMGSFWVRWERFQKRKNWEVVKGGLDVLFMYG